MIDIRIGTSGIDAPWARPEVMVNKHGFRLLVGSIGLVREHGQLCVPKYRENMSNVS